jgi:hypothetical protein
MLKNAPLSTVSGVSTPFIRTVAIARNPDIVTGISNELTPHLAQAKTGHITIAAIPGSRHLILRIAFTSLPVYIFLYRRRQ